MDPYYFSPEGKRFRSRKEVGVYLGIEEAKPGEAKALGPAQVGAEALALVALRWPLLIVGLMHLRMLTPWAAPLRLSCPRLRHAHFRTSFTLFFSSFSPYYLLNNGCSAVFTRSPPALPPPPSPPSAERRR